DMVPPSWLAARLRSGRVLVGTSAFSASALPQFYGMRCTAAASLLIGISCSIKKTFGHELFKGCGDARERRGLVFRARELLEALIRTTHWLGHLHRSQQARGHRARGHRGLGGQRPERSRLFPDDEPSDHYRQEFFLKHLKELDSLVLNGVGSGGRAGEEV